MCVVEDFTEGMIGETALGYMAHYRSPLPWANFTYPQLVEVPHAALRIFKNMNEIILRR